MITQVVFNNLFSLSMTKLQINIYTITLNLLDSNKKDKFIIPCSCFNSVEC